MIKIKDVHFEHNDGTKALNGVNLDVEAGKFAAIIGKNGAGKSTLILHLNGIYLPLCGEVLIDGVKLDKKNVAGMRKKVGIVFQNPDDMLFSPTVYDDVAFGPRNLGLDEDKVHSIVHESLRKVGMEKYEEKNPHHLSLGQKKLVSIAAIISMYPRVIIFDEPTSHLDPKGRKEIINLIKSLDCTKIVATHDMDILKHSDSVHIIDGGRIVYSGPNITEEILKKYELA